MIVAAALFNTNSTAQAGRPLIHVVPSMPAGAALGLYVPGAGGMITRAGAIASLRRGKVENALLGGKPGGKILADLVFGHAAQARGVYVQLPPPGKHPNTRRYLVGIVAPGFHGLLTSDSTRIDGLVALPDITDAAVALAQRHAPELGTTAGTVDDLMRLDRRMTRVHRDRGWTETAVVVTTLALVAVAPAAAVVAGVAAIGASLLLSCIGATRFWVVLLAMVVLTIAFAAVGSIQRRLIPVTVALFLLAYLAVLTLSGETNSLAVIGARPDGGGRFYGIGNQVETLMLAPVIAAAAVAGVRWLVPLGALALVTVGWSKAGADGGGLFVFAAALAVLSLRLQRFAFSWRRAVVAVGAVVALVFAFVGLDAALGGSSHVTDAVGTGPGSLFGDFGHRLHLSWASATRAPHAILIALGCLAGLIWIATRRPRFASVDAMLTALTVSLLVNDTPVDVLGLGALGCLALLRFESVDSRRMRRGGLIAVCFASALALAGCGSEGVVSPAPETVVGTVQQEAPGKAIFINQGCGSCHTYQPAGPEAKGNIGPDLDKLADYAKRAKQPLDTFVHESIVDPDKYVEKGYPKGVMPKSYAQLPASDLQDLVAFLTKPQG